MKRLDPKVWGPALGAVIVLALAAAFWFSNPGPDHSAPPPIQVGSGAMAPPSAPAASPAAPASSPVAGMELHVAPGTPLPAPTDPGAGGPSPARPPGPALEMPKDPGG